MSFCLGQKVSTWRGGVVSYSMPLATFFFTALFLLLGFHVLEGFLAGMGFIFYGLLEGFTIVSSLQAVCSASGVYELQDLWFPLDVAGRGVEGTRCSFLIGVGTVQPHISSLMMVSSGLRLGSWSTFRKPAGSPCHRYGHTGR